MLSTNLQGDIVNTDFTIRGLSKGNTFLLDITVSSSFFQHTPVHSSFWSLHSPLLMPVCYKSSHFRQYKAYHRPCAQHFPTLCSDSPCWHPSLKWQKSFFCLLSASSFCTISVCRKINPIFAHTAVGPCTKARGKCLGRCTRRPG